MAMKAAIRGKEVTSCIAAIDTSGCDSVAVIVEGSKDLRRRSTTMRMLGIGTDETIKTRLYKDDSTGPVHCFLDAFVFSASR